MVCVWFVCWLRVTFLQVGFMRNHFCTSFYAPLHNDPCVWIGCKLSRWKMLLLLCWQSLILIFGYTEQFSRFFANAQHFLVFQASIHNFKKSVWHAAALFLAKWILNMMQVQMLCRYTHVSTFFLWRSPLFYLSFSCLAKFCDRHTSVPKNQMYC